MIKKIHIILILFVFSLAFYETTLPQSQSEYALIPEMVWQNPPIWKLTKSVTESAWGTQLFINSRSEAQGYIMTPWYELWSAASFHLDNAWNRIVFQECLASWIYAIGDRGSGTGQFLWPSKLDVIAPCNYDLYSYLYYIYVADASNDRIVKLSYYWPLGEQEMSWDGVITGGGLSLPQDLDINDGGTHHPHSDDYLWVLNGHEIKRFTMDGVLRKTYGTYGCDPEGEGNFCRPTAVVCGRSPWLQPPYEPFANDDWIYVADQGNSRLVALIKWHGIEDIYWYKTLYSDECKHFADLEVDIFGHVWAVDKHNGRIYKYTYDLFPLCYYGSFGTGESQFYYPLDFSNTGGYLGCGNVYVTESWTDNSGGQYFVIGTDVVDFEVTSSVDYIWHYISYVLVDPSDVTIEIYDDQDQLVKTLFDATEYSGACLHVWDGTDQSGQPLGLGDYRVVVTSESGYWDVETNEPVNIVVKEAWLHHSPLSLNGPSSLAAWQSGPGCVTLNWQDNDQLEDGFAIYCDGCLCGSVGANVTAYVDSGLVPGRSYMYWVRALYSSTESSASNADTVFVGSKLLFPSVNSILPVDHGLGKPSISSQLDTTTEVSGTYNQLYPGHFAEITVLLKNPDVEISGLNFLIKCEPDLMDFRTNGISSDSILIGSEWVHYSVRECWIDGGGNASRSFDRLHGRGQVADTALPACKYLWVKAWTPPDRFFARSFNWQPLFKFGIDTRCIPDSATRREGFWDLAFGRLYDRQYQSVPFKYPPVWSFWLLWGVPGDANNDRVVDQGDIVFLMEYLYRGGPPPCIPESGDANADCLVTAGDIVYLITYLYRGGPPPKQGCWYGKKE